MILDFHSELPHVIWLDSVRRAFYGLKYGLITMNLYFGCVACLLLLLKFCNGRKVLIQYLQYTWDYIVSVLLYQVS